MPVRRAFSLSKTAASTCWSQTDILWKGSAQLIPSRSNRETLPLGAKYEQRQSPAIPCASCWNGLRSPMGRFSICEISCSLACAFTRGISGFREVSFGKDEMVQRVCFRQTSWRTIRGRDQAQDRLLAENLLRIRYRQRPLFLSASHWRFHF